MPVSVAGNSTNENSGIASALTTGPVTGTPPKAATSTGASTTHTAAWARTNCLSAGQPPGPACTSPIRAATAAKESQKPADAAPRGSVADNNSAAAASTDHGATCRRTARNARATPTMARVLTVGSEAPASSP